ncbi:hypothetical protein QBC46DRAFT_414568 [Diplogelasinospora grovesii]|uniref:Uncharacterized protein n=1 Tax=Diplogelasinospora grovesii TaxID=303347 RepID=A0AAN6MUH7_9PEZI|nr:hypothetical protein QBC46DRAFT_414568 [Diplogelasinospora grovesii]
MRLRDVVRLNRHLTPSVPGMASPQIPAAPGSYSVPIRVFFASLQEYGTYFYQWQNYAEAVAQEIYLLKIKVAELERENNDLQRITDTQREPLLSLGEDLEHRAVSSEPRFNVPLPPSVTSSTGINFESVETNLTNPLSVLVELTVSSNIKKRPAKTDT